MGAAGWDGVMVHGKVAGPISWRWLERVMDIMQKDEGGQGRW